MPDRPIFGTSANLVATSRDVWTMTTAIASAQRYQVVPVVAEMSCPGYKK